MTEQIPATPVPHKAAALLLGCARVDPILREAAEQVQDALIALERERDALRAGAVPDTGHPTADPDGFVIGRITDATSWHGGRILELWDDDVHRTLDAALEHHGQHVDSNPTSWRIFALVPAASASPSGDTGHTPDVAALTFDQYESLVRRAHVAHPEWRLGQTYVNVLHILAPQVLVAIEQLRIDCYYSDDMILKFLHKVRALLGQPARTEEETRG